MQEPGIEQPPDIAANENESEKASQSDRGRAEKRGVSVGDVGAGSQVAIGESITQIGTQVVNVFKTNLKPVMLMLSLVLIGIGVILFTLLRPEEGRGQMDGLFNVAVVAFDEHRQGQSVASAEGERIANLLVDELRRQLPEQDYLIWGPKDRKMRVSGIDPEDRFAQAVELGDEIQADVVIYGLIEKGNSLTIEPEILIHLESFILGEELLGEELDGAYHLGPQISFSGDLERPGNERALRDILTERATPISYFALGLDSYRSDDFENALISFDQAEETAEAWEGAEGKGVIYLFLGAAEMNLGMETKDHSHFAAAHDWFDMAERENEAYARSHLGHGFTYLQEVNQLLSGEEISESDIMLLLGKAEEAFGQGLNSSFKPPNSDVDAKTKYGLGRVYFLTSLYGEEQRLDEAEQQFSYVIGQFHGGNKRLQELAARSYGWLGLLNYHLRDDGQAIEAYQCALEYGGYETLKQAWTEKLDELCLEGLCQAEPMEGKCDGF